MLVYQEEGTVMHPYTRDSVLLSTQTKFQLMAATINHATQMIKAMINDYSAK